MVDAKTKRTWIAIVVAVLVVLFMMAIVLVGSAIFYVHRHIRSEFVTNAIGAEQFEHERARFDGQQPLIEMREHEPPLVHRRTATSVVPLQELRVLAFDPRAGKVVHVSIPFWMLRMMPGKRFNIGGSGQGFDFNSDRTNLTIDDLEHAGAGLLVDGTDPRSGARVLVWTE